MWRYKWCHKQRGRILIKSSLFVKPCKNKDQKVITASVSLDIKIKNFFFKRNLHLVIWDGVITPLCCTVSLQLYVCYALWMHSLFLVLFFQFVWTLALTSWLWQNWKNLILFSSPGQTWKHFSKVFVVQKWEIKWRWSGAEMKLILVKGFTKKSGEFLVSFYSE